LASKMLLCFESVVTFSRYGFCCETRKGPKRGRTDVTSRATRDRCFDF
jgi:hypothetical protein